MNRTLIMRSNSKILGIKNVIKTISEDNCIHSRMFVVDFQLGTCPGCDARKLHVSGAVSWGIRQYYSATRDRDYLINNDYLGCDVTREIARFYADQSKYDAETGRYSLLSEIEFQFSQSYILQLVTYSSLSISTVPSQFNIMLDL